MTSESALCWECCSLSQTRSSQYYIGHLKGFFDILKVNGTNSWLTAFFICRVKIFGTDLRWYWWCNGDGASTLQRSQLIVCPRSSFCPSSLPCNDCKSAIAVSRLCFLPSMCTANCPSLVVTTLHVSQANCGLPLQYLKSRHSRTFKSRLDTLQFTDILLQHTPSFILVPGEGRKEKLAIHPFYWFLDTHR